MRNRWLLFVITAVLWLPSLALAQTLYSVDWSTDELVTINASTGEVRVVGALGKDAYDTDLATLGGRLYAVDSHSWNYVELLEIDAATGAARILANLSGSIGVIPHAEGLTTRAGGLYVGYGPWGDWYGSSILGTLALDGVVTDVFDFFPGMHEADFDGLATGFDGGLLSTDNIQGFGVLLNRVGPTNPGTCDMLGYIYPPPAACCGRGDDLDFIGLRLWISNGTDGTIARISPRNGRRLEVVQLSRWAPGGYSGLAAAPVSSCQPLALTDWRRACTDKDAWGERANLDRYAADIREFDPFAGMGNGVALCTQLKAAGHDKCAQAESGFLALMLNIDSLRLGRQCCSTASGPTVTETFAAIYALLANPRRTQQDCSAAFALTDAVNSGAALCP